MSNLNRRRIHAAFPAAGSLLAGIFVLAQVFAVKAPAQDSLAPLSPQPPRVQMKAFRTNGRRPQTAACSTPQLTYYGGPVVCNANVVVVYWNSDVNSIAQSGLPGFFQGITNSTYFDLLSEYSSVSSQGFPGTGQSIGRGNLVEAVTLSPNTGSCPHKSNPQPCSLTDALIRAGLASNQIPPPVQDQNGYINTVYMIYFPSYITVTGPGGGTSCSAPPSGFCSYHSNKDTGGGDDTTPYAVVMDTFTGACSTGCGNSSVAFDNLTTLSARELADAVTDAAGPFGVPPFYSWTDTSSGCGDIGDVCNDGTASAITVPGGSTYYVQSLWSNSLNSCVTAGLHPRYSLTGPSAANAGTSIPVTLTVFDPSGAQGTDIAYVGTVHFTSTDSQATLPADYTFTEQQAGTANFSVTFGTVGAQTVTATDTVNNQIVFSLPVAVTASQTITFTTSAPASAPYQSMFTVAATASSGLSVVFTSAGSCSNSGATYTMTSGTGTCSVIANQPGNSYYSAAPTVTQTTSAQLIAPTVSFTGAPASEPYLGTFVVTAQTNAGNSAVISTNGVCTVVVTVGNSTKIAMATGTGICIIMAGWAATSDYQAASLSQKTLAVQLVTTLTWPKPKAIPYGTELGSGQLDAKAASGGVPVAGSFVYDPASGAILNVGKNTLTVTFTPTEIYDYTTPPMKSTTLMVNPTRTTSTITDTVPTVGTVGKPLQIDFVVTADYGAPTGTVTVTASNSGGTCSGTLSKKSRGLGSCNITFATPGNYNLTAVYAGSKDYLTSTSDAFPVTVVP
jgi:hypothetical protein